MLSGGRDVRTPQLWQLWPQQALAAVLLRASSSATSAARKTVGADDAWSDDGHGPRVVASALVGVVVDNGLIVGQRF
jgi:hypothetical protein